MAPWYWCNPRLTGEDNQGREILTNLPKVKNRTRSFTSSHWILQPPWPAQRGHLTCPPWSLWSKSHTHLGSQLSVGAVRLQMLVLKGEPWVAKLTGRTQGHTVCTFIYMNCKFPFTWNIEVGKSVETESRLMYAQCWKGEGWWATAWWPQCFLLGRWKSSRTKQWWRLRKTMNVLNVTNGIFYVVCILPIFFKSPSRTKQPFGCGDQGTVEGDRLFATQI